MQRCKKYTYSTEGFINNKSKLLTIQEAAAFVGVSNAYMRELLQKGEIAHIRLGPPPLKGKADKRRYRIAEEDLENYIYMRRVAGTGRGVRDVNIREWRRRGTV